MTPRTLAKKTREVLDTHSQEWEKDRNCLRIYSNGGNSFSDTVDKTKLASPPFRYKVAATFNYLVGGLAEARLDLYERENHNPVPVLRRAYGYSYWRVRIEHHDQIKSTSRNGGCFKTAVAALAGCLYCGWMSEAEKLAKEVLILYRQHRFYDVRGEFSQPLYHWLIRICFDYWGWDFNDWGWDCFTHNPEPPGSPENHLTNRTPQPPVQDNFAEHECFCEPVLNSLFVHWRDEDLTPLNDHLLWLCDYYTHRTRAADGMEFGNDLLHTRFPATILAWFRLRDQLGLKNPVIDHPLVQPAYVFLPERESMYSDELLDATLARLRLEEIPDLGGMPEEPTTASPKRGWLHRLIGRRD